MIFFFAFFYLINASENSLPFAVFLDVNLHSVKKQNIHEYPVGYTLRLTSIFLLYQRHLQ